MAENLFWLGVETFLKKIYEKRSIPLILIFLSSNSLRNKKKKSEKMQEKRKEVKIFVFLEYFFKFIHMFYHYRIKFSYS